MTVYRLAPGSAPVLTPSADAARDAVFLLGYFDGVHAGHRALLRQALSLAAAPSGGKKRPVVVWTFASLPKPSAEPGLLTPLEEKLTLFASLGADYMVLADFYEIRSLSGEDFFRSQLLEPFAPYAVVCGENFRFGRHASCGHAELERFAAAHGVLCRVLPLLPAADGTPVSSTEIRRCILSGAIGKANRLLCAPFSVTSPVLHGKALGRTIGCPTINQRLPAEKIVPAYGVYACTVTFTPPGQEPVTCAGVCNIGSRPTVNTNTGDITLETYLLDFSADLYGFPVTTRLYARIRGEKTFSSVDELSREIQRNARQAREDLLRQGISFSAYTDSACKEDAR